MNDTYGDNVDLFLLTLLDSLETFAEGVRGDLTPSQLSELSSVARNPFTPIRQLQKVDVSRSDLASEIDSNVHKITLGMLSERDDLKEVLTPVTNIERGATTVRGSRVIHPLNTRELHILSRLESTSSRLDSTSLLCAGETTLRYCSKVLRSLLEIADVQNSRIFKTYVVVGSKNVEVSHWAVAATSESNGSGAHTVSEVSSMRTLLPIALLVVASAIKFDIQDNSGIPLKITSGLTFLEHRLTSTDFFMSILKRRYEEDGDKFPLKSLFEYLVSKGRDTQREMWENLLQSRTVRVAIDVFHKLIMSHDPVQEYLNPNIKASRSIVREYSDSCVRPVLLTLDNAVLNLVAVGDIEIGVKVSLKHVEVITPTSNSILQASHVIDMSDGIIDALRKGRMPRTVESTLLEVPVDLIIKKVFGNRHLYRLSGGLYTLRALQNVVPTRKTGYIKAILNDSSAYHDGKKGSMLNTGSLSKKTLSTLVSSLRKVVPTLSQLTLYYKVQTNHAT